MQNVGISPFQRRHALRRLAVKSSSPRIARSVTSATSSPVPASLQFHQCTQSGSPLSPCPSPAARRAQMRNFTQRRNIQFGVMRQFCTRR
jgi:hypothetical protein